MSHDNRDIAENRLTADSSQPLTSDTTSPGLPPPGRTSRALAWNFALTSFGMLTIFALEYGILPRWLSVRGNDTFSKLWVLACWMVFFSQSGLQASLLRFIPLLDSNKSYRQVSRLYYLVLGTQLAIWGVCTAVLFLGKGYILRGLRLPMLPLAVALVFVLFRLVLNSQLSVLQAFRDVKWITIVQVSMRSLALAATFLVLGGWLANPVAAIAAWLGVSAPIGLSDSKVIVCFAALAGSDLLSTVLTRRHMTRHYRRHSAGRETVAMRRLLWYATPLLLRSALFYVEQGPVNTFLLGLLGEDGLAASYERALWPALKIVEFVPVAIWPIVLATFAESYARDPRTLAKGAALYYRLLAILLLPLAVGGALFGDRVILALMGPKYAAAALPCQLFFALIVVRIFSAPLTVCLHVIEKTWLLVIATVAGAAVNLVLAVVLIPVWGIVGAVVPVGLSWATITAIQYGSVKRKVPGFRVPWADLARVALGCCPLALAVLLKPHVAGPLSLVAAIVACAILTVAGYRLFKVIDAATLRLILASRLPMKGLIAVVFASTRIREQAQMDEREEPRR